MDRVRLPASHLIAGECLCHDGVGRWEIWEGEGSVDRLNRCEGARGGLFGPFWPVVAALKAERRES
jgi:hypothetical protein